MKARTFKDKQYVGIDVSQDYLDIAVYPNGYKDRIENTIKALKAFGRSYLSKHDIVSITVESTGGYEENVILALQGKWKVLRAHPTHVHNFARALGQRAKTDKIDALIIARYGEFDKGSKSKEVILSDEDISLRALVHRRGQLVGILLAEQCRLRQAGTSFIKKGIENIIHILNKQKELIDQQIDQLIQTSKEKKESRRLLCSFKGVGNCISAVLIADLPELGTLNKRQVAALVGVAPYNRDSGKTTGKRFIYGGRGNIRNALYMAALVAIQHNKVIKFFYEKLIKAGKIFKVAIVAVMRKILVILNTMLRFKQTWKFAN
jgi:transposase